MKKVFVFPGQGAQSVGMGNGFSVSGRIWKRADEIMGWKLSEVVMTGPEESLALTKVTQPAVYVTEIIILEELKAMGFVPEAAAGHSLGEYAAVAASGALSWEDGLELVKFRGELFEETGANHPGGMLAVIGLEEEQINGIAAELDGVCQVVNYNSPGQLVVSAEKRLLKTAAEKMNAAGARMVIPLKVSGGFHSSLMDDAVEPMRAKVESLNFSDPGVAFYSNSAGRAVKTADEIKDCLARQVNSPVRWIDIINNIRTDLGEEILFIEAGPGKVLQGLLRRIDRKNSVKGVSEPGDLAGLPSN